MWNWIYLHQERRNKWCCMVNVRSNDRTNQVAIYNEMKCFQSWISCSELIDRKISAFISRLNRVVIYKYNTSEYECVGGIECLLATIPPIPLNFLVNPHPEHFIFCSFSTPLIYSFLITHYCYMCCFCLLPIVVPVDDRTVLKYDTNVQTKR